MAGAVQACAHCGSSDGSKGGRCRSCGSLTDVTTVVRRERLRNLLSFDAWDWAGELVGLAVLALVLSDVLPVWMLVIAIVLTLRPFVRFAFRVAARVLLES